MYVYRRSPPPTVCMFNEVTTSILCIFNEVTTSFSICLTRLPPRLCVYCLRVMTCSSAVLHRQARHRRGSMSRSRRRCSSFKCSPWGAGKAGLVVGLHLTDWASVTVFSGARCSSTDSTLGHNLQWCTKNMYGNS